MAKIKSTNTKTKDKGLTKVLMVMGGIIIFVVALGMLLAAFT